MILWVLWCIGLVVFMGLLYIIRHEHRITKLRRDLYEVWEVIAATEDPPKGSVTPEWIRRQKENASRQLPPPVNRAADFKRFKTRGEL